MEVTRTKEYSHCEVKKKFLYPVYAWEGMVKNESIYYQGESSY